MRIPILFEAYIIKEEDDTTDIQTAFFQRLQHFDSKL
jgi:hypothetical protein